MLHRVYLSLLCATLQREPVLTYSSDGGSQRNKNYSDMINTEAVWCLATSG